MRVQSDLTCNLQQCVMPIFYIVKRFIKTIGHKNAITSFRTFVISMFYMNFFYLAALFLNSFTNFNFMILDWNVIEQN